MKTYKEIPAFNRFHLKVDEIHEIYIEESGKKDGIPLLVIHGGPGGCLNEEIRKLFDPEVYRIIQYSQRGCKKSRPFLELRNNNTDELIGDIEKIRKALKVERFVIFAGSFGTTLALLYAQKYPECVRGLILRGVFLARDEDVKWLYEGGVSNFFPEEYEKFKELNDSEESNISFYYKKLTENSGDKFKKYAKRFADYESSIVTLKPTKPKEEINDVDLSIALFESYYFNHHTFIEENQILKNCHVIKDIPTIIIHGRYDVDCRLKGAYELKRKLQNAVLKIPVAGHSTFDLKMRDEILIAQKDILEMIK